MRDTNTSTSPAAQAALFNTTPPQKKEKDRVTGPFPFSAVLRVGHVLGAARQERFQVFRHGVHQPRPGLPGGPADVWCDDAVFGGEQGAVRGGGFLGQHVQAGAGQPALVEGGGQGGLVDEAAPGGVEEQGGGLHQRQALPVYQALGLGG